MRTSLIALAFTALAAGVARAEHPQVPLPGSAAHFVTSGITRSAELARPTRCSARGAYTWPLKPFRSPHPVRGNFGDPRTVFSSVWRMSFHNGIDISAPAGTNIYPVVSGTVFHAGTHDVIVRTRDGRSFQYWHIKPRARPGQRVSARKTILGTVQRPALHVHFAEIDNGVVRNPLAPGHLGPYYDWKAPVVHGIAFRDEGGAVDPRSLRGAAEVIVWGDDATALPVPGRWRGLPVAPARLAYSVVREDGTIVVAERTVVDFRYTLPDVERFFDVYATGTYQNVPAVGRLLMRRTAGRYLYRFELPALPAGRLLLQVVAEDICGNRGLLTRQVTVPSPPAQPEPEPPPRVAPKATAHAQGKPWSWPHARTAYTVVVASVPEGQRADAIRRAREALAARLPRVGILRSSRFPNLAPGYLVVFSGVYATASDAILASLNVGDGYPRLVVAGRPKARRGTYVLASVPASSGLAAARSEAFRARAAGIRRVRVVRSDRLRGFHPGYFVVLGDRTASIYPGAYLRTLRLG
jgi:murein DD-endopeptidase MepM/ murein hydrolase activator NlpD